jgi:hypothetical protein
MSDGNGHTESTVFVRFGPKETQELHLETAEELLTLWRQRKPKDFGKLLAEVVTGVAPTGAASKGR